MLVETDDYFCHQIVDTHAHVLLNDPSWAERVFFTVSFPDRFGLDIGLSLYANNDTIEAYAVTSLPGGRQTALRASRDLSDGRWPLAVGPVAMDVLDPLTRWRLRCEPNESGIEFDLEYVARGKPYGTRPPTLYRRGRLMYDNVMMFQPGRFHGELRVHGEAIEIDGVAGNRDRSWGVRASGEGRFQRGLVATMFAEFDDLSITAMIHDRYDETPVVRAGAVTVEGGEPVPIVEFAHDLSFDYESRQLQHARFRLVDASERTWEIEAEPTLRLFLAAAGYTSNERRRGNLGMPFWTERWDLHDPETVRRADDLNDTICRIRCGALIGHGLVETMLGEHDRYVVRHRDV